jgi:NitT/TauT family transport system substrate-binding protein
MNTLNAIKGRSFSRRRFLASTPALGAGSLVGLPRTAAAEPPPEVKKIRLVANPTAICFAPQFLAEEVLAMEGFTDIEYVELKDGNYVDLVDQGIADISMDAAPTIVYGMETRKSVVVLAGIHAGCYELFANGPIHSIRDLKGKTLPIYAKGGADHVLLASMLAYVGVDPTREVNWLVPDDRDTMRLFVEGKVEALMAFPPGPQELRARKIGRVIVNTAQDRPWSHQFCCVASGNREFVRKNPVATKRALRSLLKAADICAEDPARAARFLVERGHTVRYETALEVMRDVPYRRWRETDPEDTLRFLALRLHEVGMIKTSPQKLIAEGTDWRFLNALKRELKA